MTSKTATHRLVRYGDQHEWIAEFDSYEAALAAHAAITDKITGEHAELRKLAFAVRHVEDPQWKGARPTDDDDLRRAARNAAAEWRRKEIGATAASMIRAHGDDSLEQVMRAVRTSLKERGIQFEGFEVEQAVKGRVIVGRCRRSTYGGGCGRAFWMPRSQGRLADQHCPHCNRPLHQTTLAFQGTFARLQTAAH